tara:strand:- start:558 stop:890 length:333 start_codon:yes stop_codon:yes gene_type:complete
MAFKMKGFTPFTLFNNQNRAQRVRGGDQYLRSGRESGVTRSFQEQSESQKSNFRKKIESGKGLWAKILGGKREDGVYKPGIADFRLFGGVGHRNLKRGDSAANTRKRHSR